MASTWLTKRGKKLAEPNLARTTATAAKFWTPPTIETVVHANKEVICLYIDAWI